MYDFLSSLSTTSPSIAAPWQQKVPKIHQSAVDLELLLLSEITLALVVLIPWQNRTKCQSAEILCETALPSFRQLYSNVIGRTKLTAEPLLQ